MNSNDTYNMLVNTIANSGSEEIKPETFNLSFQEFEVIIKEIENDGLFEKGHWALAGYYIFMGLTFKGKNFIENNDKKEYHKIYKTDIDNSTHIHVGHDNIGNIVVGNNNRSKSVYEQKVDKLIEAIRNSDLKDKNEIIEAIEEKSSDQNDLQGFLASLLARGAEVASVTSAIGNFFS